MSFCVRVRHFSDFLRKEESMAFCSSMYIHVHPLLIFSIARLSVQNETVADERFSPREPRKSHRPLGRYPQNKIRHSEFPAWLTSFLRRVLRPRFSLPFLCEVLWKHPLAGNRERTSSALPSEPVKLTES